MVFMFISSSVFDQAAIWIIGGNNNMAAFMTQDTTTSASGETHIHSEAHTEDFEFHCTFDHLFGYYSKLYNDLSWV